MWEKKMSGMRNRKKGGLSSRRPLLRQSIPWATSCSRTRRPTSAALSDELLLDVLGLLRGRDLAVLSTVSKSLYVFSTHEPLWRSLVLDELEDRFSFAGSWRSTYASASAVSPLLFQSWLYANMEMKPEWVAGDNIERRRGISADEFVARFEEPNKPVLLEGCLDGWPGLRKWTREHLLRVCDDIEFSVGPAQMTLRRYFRYADAAREQRPLYLFDHKFAEKVPELDSDYQAPVYFREDLFALLGRERPDYRWVIIGPSGSGSSFHVGLECCGQRVEEVGDAPAGGCAARRPPPPRRG